MFVGIHISAHDVPNIKMTACQIFTVVPQQLKIVAFDEVALRRASASLHIWIHSSYLVSPWGSKNYNVPFCIKQLKQQVAIKARGVIFHIPKAPAASLVAGLKHLVETKPLKSRIVLENKAVRPDFTTYETPEKINGLVETFIKGGIPVRDIWLCFDTAHLHSSGVSLRSHRDAERWLSAIKYPERICLFHLNGSSSATFADKHAIAFGPDDLIWGGMQWEDSGAAAILSFCQDRKIDIIVECDFERERVDAISLIKRLQTKRKKC